MSLQHSEEDKNSPRKKISNLYSEAFKLSLRIWEREIEDAALRASRAKAVGLSSASSGEVSLKDAAFSDEDIAKLKGVLSKANYNLKSCPNMQNVNLPTQINRVISLLSSLLESQIASTEYWLKSKDKSIDYLIEQSKDYKAECDVLKDQLLNANHKIKVLEEHVEQYTKVHTAWTDFSE